MITKTLPFLLAAALGLSTSVMAQTTATSAKAKPVSLTQQVQDLKATVLQLQKRVDYLEMLVPPSTAVLMPDARKLSSIPARVQRRWVLSLRVSRLISLSSRFSLCLAAVSFFSATYCSRFSFSNFSLDIGSTPFAIMDKTKATNFLRLIAFGLVIIH